MSGPIRGIADAADAGEAYVRKYAEVSFGQEGLILDLVGPHDHAYAVVHGAMTAIARITERTGAAVDALAARLDEPAEPDQVRPVTDPTVHFRDADQAGDGVGFDLDGDPLSPPAVIREVVYQLAGVDPFVWMVGWLRGDWAAYRTCGTAWEHVADACPDFATNLTRAAGDTPGRYREPLRLLAAAVEEIQLTCEVLAENYRAAAEVASQLHEALTVVAGEIVDTVLMAMAAAAVGDATVETAVGPVTGYGAAAYHARQVLDLINEAVTLYGRSRTVVAGITTTVRDLDAITVQEEGN
ncbi:hypothetical protein BLA60_02185 [Actinophytocola xinjiangensis]|uniref:Excreted virulence factor EspC (Type VII ESX diderm) n=1 Tax=Actinophytocola xinjiangensis TaxID=485602 RepID=A0A7Z0WSK7_9PSEU|nr:hypothetical protein [Actinophytocola xinjiangensis]OLF14009.1 hypothetical protein BLA60_02185 [Actinophytocola xinjiangensis]